MPDETLDLGYEENENSEITESSENDGNSGESTDLGTGKIESSNTTIPSENLNESENETETNSDNAPIITPSGLEAGTEIEADGESYFVDNSGNLIADDGSIFKRADEVKEWLDSFESVEGQSENEQDLIDSIQDAIGIDIYDTDDNIVEFENSVDGITNYINAVVESSKEEHYEAAINNLEQRFPILKDVLNYYLANGNSLEGFNDNRTYEGIFVDQNNENQQEAIIRTAWEETGRKGDLEGYISYLKSAGTLFDTAEQELVGLQEMEEQRQAALEEQADLAEQKRIQDMETYWNNVKGIIDNRKIAGYMIPESIIINRNGGRIAVTPNDFFDYVYRVDKNGKSAYERDLMQESIQDRMEDEILRAYIKFVGGNYSNLVNMAINEENVKQLKLRSKNTRNTSVRINKPKTSSKGNDIDLGYD